MVDTAAAKVIKTFKVGRRPRSIAFMPDGSRAYVNAENDGNVVVVDAVKHEAVRAIQLGQPGVIKPMGLASVSRCFPALRDHRSRTPGVLYRYGQ